MRNSASFLKFPFSKFPRIFRSNSGGFLMKKVEKTVLNSRIINIFILGIKYYSILIIIIIAGKSRISKQML